MANRKRATKSKVDRTSGIVWMFFGLAIGLVVAAGVYVADRWDLSTNDTVQVAVEVVPLITTPEPSEELVAADEQHPATRFDFYDDVTEI